MVVVQRERGMVGGGYMKVCKKRCWMDFGYMWLQMDEREGSQEQGSALLLGVRHGRACASAEALAGCTPLVPCSCAAVQLGCNAVTFFLKKNIWAVLLLSRH